MKNNKQRTYSIRMMTRQEVDMAIDWAAAEGWNPGLDDGDCFYAADPHGFLVGLLDDEPIATISAVRYGDSFGFIGFYIVKPKYRGMGYGMQLWHAAMTHLRGRTIGLDGVVAQQGNYAKSGFTLAYRNVRYQGTGGGAMPTASGIVRLDTIPFDEIHAYDTPLFPDNRQQFLRCWLTLPRSTAFGFHNKNTLAGYGVMRGCRTGYKIGPLFAECPEFAEHIFLALKAQAPKGVPVFLDTPAVNTAAVALAEKYGMTASFETARMYAGTHPELPTDRVYGVTTFELG
ncbi:MAG: GNAT family N-acetyltransferase [Desulfobulbaceae bacterium A2]|nr:MAG: GNAT family N-acetyltransferase [Desulfobulbaceae bacterium A2]